MRFSINIEDSAWPDIAGELAGVGLADEIGLFDVPGKSGGDNAQARCTAAALRRNRQALRAHRKTLSAGPETTETAEQFASRPAAFGIEHLVVITNDLWNRESLERLAGAAAVVNR